MLNLWNSLQPVITPWQLMQPKKLSFDQCKRKCRRTLAVFKKKCAWQARLLASCREWLKDVDRPDIPWGGGRVSSFLTTCGLTYLWILESTALKRIFVSEMRAIHISLLLICSATNTSKLHTVHMLTGNTRRICIDSWFRTLWCCTQQIEVIIVSH